MKGVAAALIECDPCFSPLSKVGADAVLVHPRGYFRSLMTPEALFEHFTRVADESPVPVLPI